MNDQVASYYWKWIYREDKECPTLDAFREFIRALPNSDKSGSDRG